MAPHSKIIEYALYFNNASIFRGLIDVLKCQYFKPCRKKWKQIWLAYQRGATQPIRFVYNFPKTSDNIVLPKIQKPKSAWYAKDSHRPRLLLKKASASFLTKLFGSVGRIRYKTVSVKMATARFPLLEYLNFLDTYI